MGVVHARGDCFDGLKVCASTQWTHVHDLTAADIVRFVCTDSGRHTGGGGVVHVVWLYACPHEPHGDTSTPNRV